MNKRYALFLLLLSTLLVAGFGCTMTTATPSVDPASAPATATPTTDQTPTANPTSGGLYDQATYSSGPLGITFSYGKNFFTPTEQAGILTLASQFYVSDNPSGLPDHDTKHPIAITMVVENKNVLDALRANDPSWAKNYTATKINSMKKEPAVLDPAEAGELSTVGGHEAYTFIQGIEGVNTKAVYVLAGPDRTLIIRYSYITDFLKDGMRPDWLPEAEQQKLFSTIINSIEFK